MFGPFRSCIYPRTLRSRRVRNATASSTGTIKAKGLIICEMRMEVMGVGERI